MKLFIFKEGKKIFFDGFQRKYFFSNFSDFVYCKNFITTGCEQFLILILIQSNVEIIKNVIIVNYTEKKIV